MQPSNRSALDRSSRLTSKVIAAVLCVTSIISLQAASGNWTGLGADDLWSTTLNWSGATPPGTGGQVATFNSAGNGKTIINLGTGVGVSNLAFDTASAAAYTIGAGAVGSQTLTLNSNITMNATVVADQLINANVVLNAATANRSFTNNSTTNSLNFAGSISANTAATPLTFTGAGASNVSGNITNGTGTLNVIKGGTGTLSFSGTNVFNSLAIGNATVRVTGGSTTTAISYTSGSTSFTVTGGSVNATSITSGSNSNGRALNLNGGTFVSNGDVFVSGTAGAITFNGGTLKSGNAAGITVFDDNNTVNIGSSGATFDLSGGNITLGAGVALSTANNVTFQGATGNTFTATTLSLANTNTLSFELDNVAINNPLALVSLTNFTEALDGGSYNIDFGGFNFDTVGSYQLVGFNNASASFIDSDFVATNFLLGSGLTANFVLDGSSLSYSVATAIPEPSTFACLAGALVLGFVVLRRRRSA